MQPHDVADAGGARGAAGEAGPCASAPAPPQPPQQGAQEEQNWQQRQPHGVQQELPRQQQQAARPSAAALAEHVAASLAAARAGAPPLPAGVLAMEGMSGAATRRLYNALCRFPFPGGCRCLQVRRRARRRRPLAPPPLKPTPESPPSWPALEAASIGRAPSTRSSLARLTPHPHPLHPLHAPRHRSAAAPPRCCKVGVWKGSTVVAALAGSAGCRVTAVDNWSEFGGPRAAFEAAAAALLTEDERARLQASGWGGRAGGGAAMRPPLQQAVAGACLPLR
jgi:hypothetical protein